MRLNPTPEQIRALEIENQVFPACLVEMSIPPGIPLPPGLRRLWRSRDFLVQGYEERDGAMRLTVCRTSIDTGTGRWDDGIAWDELQQLKREAGFGGRWAVEIYPDDAETVNVGNLRHLWLLPEAPAYAWRK